MKNSKSQFFQDVFALTTTLNKTYIEIGARHPIKYSNTHLLEQHGWKGFSLEINQAHKSFWDSCNERKNKIYWQDALNFNYTSALKENNMLSKVGYLSCDIEPPINTFSALRRIIEQGISFDCITFEHDKYQSDINYDPIVTKYLEERGYKIAVKDVYRNKKYRLTDKKRKTSKKCYLETWYVNNDIDFNSTTFDLWKDLNIINV